MLYARGMQTQNEIKAKLSQPANIEFICGLIGSGQYKNCKELTKFICRHFGFFDINGSEQHAGCQKALRKLEAKGHFVLPGVKFKKRTSSPRRLHKPVPTPIDVPAQVNEVRGLKLILVVDDSQMRIWNELMITEHPLGAGPFVGRQLRYLIDSEHGILGGLGFSAAALHLSERDEWIGWSKDQRQQYLHYVVGLSRFLIRPAVKCSNLASKALSMCLRVMVEDFEKRYSYKPLLVESFVEADQTGTCFRAANWIKIGQTKGRGRQDTSNKKSLSIKDIYVYELDDDFRAALNIGSIKAAEPIELTAGLDPDQWARNEFGGVPVGDMRLSNRLVRAAQDMGEHPGVAYCGIPGVDWAATKGYYRMIDSPDESAVSMPNIMLTHRERTIGRMSACNTVLCIQDGTDLNYNNLDKCTGLGIIGKNQTKAESRGLHMHSTLVTTTEGIPLGVLRAQCVAPTPKSREEDRPWYKIPIEEKKNFVWIEYYRDLVEIKKQLPDTRLICVCDREADFFKFFDEQRKHSEVELLVRAKHDRNIDQSGSKLFSTVSQSPVLGQVGIVVPRQSARNKKSKKKARDKRNKRQATLNIRVRKVRLLPSFHHSHIEPVDVWAVHAREEHPPENKKAVEWFLLSTTKVISFEDACQCLEWYCRRWRIEEWHRVLKTGCRIESMAHKTAQRLRRAIAINLIVAWRIMLMTLLGREAPELPAELLFSDLELKVLRAHAIKKTQTTRSVRCSSALDC